jgi:hypothetical protein
MQHCIKHWQKVTIIFLVACVALSYLPAQAAAPVPAVARVPTGARGPAPALPTQVGPDQYTVEDCGRIDKAQVRDEIEAHALAVISAGSTATTAPDASGTTPNASSGVTRNEIDRLVERKWAELDMDTAVDTAVQQAVANLGAQEAYWDKLVSGWWGEKAQEYAERIANDAFSSPAFQVKLEELSTAVGGEVARQVESQFAAAASVALLCLKEYVGEQYSAELFNAFERSVVADTAQVDLSGTSPVIAGAIEQHGLALAGVGTILVTQLVYRLGQKLTQKIAQRVAGKVVGRVAGRAGSSFIPVAGWVIGVALIAYDLWEGNQGALPQIQEALQSEEVKSKIREEIATAIKDDLPDQAALIALETSVSLVEQWQGFCTRFGDVCQVADQNEEFRSLLRFVALDELDRLSTLVAWFLNQEGRRSLDMAVGDGSLEQLLALPDSTVAAMVAALPPHTALGWLEVAGTRFDRVLELGMYRLAQPEEFDAYSVGALMALSNPADLQKLLALAPVQRDVLLALPADTLQTLAGDNSITQLAILANRMLEPAASPTAAVQIAEDVAQGNFTIDEAAGALVAAPGRQAVGDAAGQTGGGGSTQLPGQNPGAAAAGDPAGGPVGSAQTAPGLQGDPGNGNIRVLGILAIGAILVAAAAVAFGYLQRRNARS